MEKIEIRINSEILSYPICISHCNLETLKDDILNFVGQKKYIFVVDSNVYKIYSKILDLKNEKCFILKSGEAQKNIKNFQKISEYLMKNELTRSDYVIAVGGGVTGDLAGFAASCYKRGINLIQIPTTLLADTDSSVGGKTAINTSYGKNLIGAFYQPKAVFINVNFLKTLDYTQYNSGLGEVLKYAFIEQSCCENSENSLISFLTNNHKQIIDRNPIILAKIIKKCIELKASVVQKDEKETGLRKILNYGHTYAHALETITKYKKYTHGHCVIEGIYFALNLAQKLGKIDKEYKFLCTDLIEKFGYKRLKKYNSSKIIQIMKEDKKSDGEDITYILPTGYATVGEFKLTLAGLASLMEEL